MEFIKSCIGLAPRYIKYDDIPEEHFRAAGTDYFNGLSKRVEGDYVSAWHTESQENTQAKMAEHAARAATVISGDVEVQQKSLARERVTLQSQVMSSKRPLPQDLQAKVRDVIEGTHMRQESVQVALWKTITLEAVISAENFTPKNDGSHKNPVFVYGHHRQESAVMKDQARAAKRLIDPSPRPPSPTFVVADIPGVLPSSMSDPSKLSVEPSIARTDSPGSSPDRLVRRLKTDDWSMHGGKRLEPISISGLADL